MQERIRLIQFRISKKRFPFQTSDTLLKNMIGILDKSKVVMQPHNSLSERNIDIAK